MPHTETISTSEIANLYPPKNGHGIPFEEILYKGTQFEAEFIDSFSGRKMFFTASRRELSIYDYMFPRYHIEATHRDDEAISFSLKTRITNNDDGDPGLINDRHPDLFAKEFICLAIKYFESLGINIKYIYSTWYIGSDNYHDFNQVYELTDDEIEAARQTWSGKKFGELGFNNIDSIEIITRGADTRVNLCFSRRDNSCLPIEALA